MAYSLFSSPVDYGSTKSKDSNGILLTDTQPATAQQRCDTRSEQKELSWKEREEELSWLLGYFLYELRQVYPPGFYKQQKKSKESLHPPKLNASILVYSVKAPEKDADRLREEDKQSHEYREVPLFKNSVDQFFTNTLFDSNVKDAGAGKEKRCIIAVGNSNEGFWDYFTNPFDEEYSYATSTYYVESAFRQEVNSIYSEFFLEVRDIRTEGKRKCAVVNFPIGSQGSLNFPSSLPSLSLSEPQIFVQIYRLFNQAKDEKECIFLHGEKGKEGPKTQLAFIFALLSKAEEVFAVGANSNRYHVAKIAVGIFSNLWGKEQTGFVENEHQLAVAFYIAGYIHFNKKILDKLIQNPEEEISLPVARDQVIKQGIMNLNNHISEPASYSCSCLCLPFWCCGSKDKQQTSSGNDKTPADQQMEGGSELPLLATSAASKQRLVNS